MKMRQYKNYILAKSNNRDNIRKFKRSGGAKVNGIYQPFALDGYIPTPAPRLLLDSLAPSHWYRRVEEILQVDGSSLIPEWRKDNWGVTSDVFEFHQREVDKNYWAFEFTSIDSLPVRAFQRLSENFPKVQFHHRYFVVGEQIAGEIAYSDGMPTTENRFEGHAYQNLMSKLEGQGVFLAFDMGEQGVCYDQRFKGETIDPNFAGKVIDQYSLMYGVTFQ